MRLICKAESYELDQLILYHKFYFYYKYNISKIDLERLLCYILFFIKYIFVLALLFKINLRLNLKVYYKIAKLLK